MLYEPTATRRRGRDHFDAKRPRLMFLRSPRYRSTPKPNRKITDQTGPGRGGKSARPPSDSKIAQCQMDLLDLE